AVPRRRPSRMEWRRRAESAGSSSLLSASYDEDHSTRRNASSEKPRSSAAAIQQSCVDLSSSFPLRFASIKTIESSFHATTSQHPEYVPPFASAIPSKRDVTRVSAMG